MVDNVVVLPADTSLGMARVPIKSRCGPGGQARAQAPSRRVRPALTKVRRLIAAARLRSQAWFLATPR